MRSVQGIGIAVWVVDFVCFVATTILLAIFVSLRLETTNDAWFLVWVVIS